MAYPAALDTSVTLPNPSSSNNTNSPSHASLHDSENAAIIALETKVGIGSSTPIANSFLFGTGSGTSAWTQITSSQLASSLTDETGSGANAFANTPTLVTPKVDTINESTLNNGVTVGGVNLKAGVVTGSLANNTVTTASIAANAVTGAKIASYSTVRQDNTTNNTETTARILTGWGFITAGGSVTAVNESVTFNSAFSSIPIVNATWGGDSTGATTYGSGALNVQGAAYAMAYSITTTGFNVKIQAVGTWTAGNVIFYQWTAIGA